MKNKVIALSLLAMIACNDQKDKEADKIIESKEATGMNKKNNPSGVIDLTDFKFKTNVKTVLGAYGQTLDDNALTEYNLSGDYEEFQFASPKASLFGVQADAEKTVLSLFYLKKSFELFCYELETTDNKNALKIIDGFQKKYTKPAFSKVSGTKTGTTFLDENGEPETDDIEEKIMVFEDQAAKQTFFLFYTINSTKKPAEGKLQVIALDKSSAKYKEWVSYRSLDMYYNK